MRRVIFACKSSVTTIGVSRSKGFPGVPKDFSFYIVFAFRRLRAMHREQQSIRLGTLRFCSNFAR